MVVARMQLLVVAPHATTVSTRNAARRPARPVPKNAEALYSFSVRPLAFRRGGVQPLSRTHGRVSVLRREALQRM